jgi:hypothetical protein
MSGVNVNQPYAPNWEGLVGALQDFQSTMPTPIVYKIVGFDAETFENVNQGDALYARASDGKLGKAIANDTFDKANVAGIAETTKLSGEIVRAIVRGVVATSGLDSGDFYFLSNASAGAITKTAPTTSGHYQTVIGEAGTSAQLVIKLEPPVLLS